MDEIHQWRRRAQRSRSRTPAAKDRLKDDRPSTPVRHIKSKLSSSSTPNLRKPSFDNHFTPSRPSRQPSSIPDPNPSAEAGMDSVLRRLLSSPCAPLDVQFNGILLRIFEAFLLLRDEKDVLQVKLDLVQREQTAIVSGLEVVQREWLQEKEEYKLEIKRLEILLARTSERGVAEVTLARQESQIRRHRPSTGTRKVDYGPAIGTPAVKENVIEILDRTLRRDQHLWNNQRATIRTCSQPNLDGHSVSTPQRNSPQKSVTKTQTQRLHSHGSPTLEGLSSSGESLVQGLSLNAQDMGDFPSARLSYLSDMSFSSVSVDTDLLQEHNVATNATSVDGGVESLILGKSTRSLDRHSSQVIPKTMMPTVGHEQQMKETVKGCSAPNTRISSPSSHRQKHKYEGSSTPTKRLKIKQRASGFFSKLLSQSNVGVSSNDTALEQHCRYSFVPGDEKLRSDIVTPATTGRSMSRSLSLGSLLHTSRGPRGHNTDSPPSSPTHKSIPEAYTISTA